MNSILIKNVVLENGRGTIAVRGNRIVKYNPDDSFDTVIDGSRYLALPPFYNTHCHAAMTLLRGIADDMELFEWLNQHIWPAEAKLTREDVYIGSKLAVLEMIKSGTVFFNDMYFMPCETARAAAELGIRASIGMIFLDSASPESRKKFEDGSRELLERLPDFPETIFATYAPHAIYTVTEDTLRAIAEKSRNDHRHVHIHLSETEREVEECRAARGGMTPPEYLDRLGLLNRNLLAAHSVHLSDSDVELLRERGVTLSYMPCSNYKLSSGKFRFRYASDAGCRIAFGTDGCASNNNLSMFDEMKFGALGAKLEFGKPTACSVSEIFRDATLNGAEAFGIDAGRLVPGKLADIMLIDLDTPMMVADHNLISNVVYSADSGCVDTVICNGKIIMRNREVPGEKEIIEQARTVCRKFR